jgi:hypothetical protein
MRKKMLKIAALGIITALIAFVAVSQAAAGSLEKGSSYTEGRKVVYGTNADIGDMTAKGGAVGVFVADGLAVEGEGMSYSINGERDQLDAKAKEALSAAIAARWHFIQGEKGSMHVGVGAGSIVSDKPLSRELSKQTLSQQAEMGFSLALKENVSLKATGRYQRMGDALDPGMEAMGGNFGVKISF